MITVKANDISILSLGRQGENLARQVVFDLSAWVEEYGPGVVELIAQRPGDDAPYPVAVRRDGESMLWDLTAADTAVADGYGRCELRWYVGDILAKSKIWRTWVEPAMDTPSETAPPEPEQGWVDQVLAAGAAAMTAADGAKADAERAAALAAEVAEKAAQTAQDASDAAKAMEAAQTAQRLAEAAQKAAETAKQAAETAQSAANKSATDADGAKQAAEAALKATQDAAAEAAQSLSELRALYEQMQEWAAGVVQAVTEEGNRQVQAVRDEGTAQTANAKAQADAAKSSAADAAQSAQQAEESAAVYDDVVADVAQLKQDLSDVNKIAEKAYIMTDARDNKKYGMEWGVNNDGYPTVTFKEVTE